MPVKPPFDPCRSLTKKKERLIYAIARFNDSQTWNNLQSMK